MEGAAAATSAIFPAPPAFYKLYAPDAPLLPPAPPPPVPSRVTVFGRQVLLEEPLVAPLLTQRLFAAREDGTIDFKGQLHELTTQLMFLHLELLRVLADNPTKYVDTINLINTLMANIQHLINLMRPHQARSNLEYTLRLQLEARQAALARLRHGVAAVEQVLRDASKALLDAHGDTAESRARPQPMAVE